MRACGRQLDSIADLVVEQEYILQTAEPPAMFDVGAFRGYRLDIGPGPEYRDQPTEIVTELPDDWDSRYPDLVFERSAAVTWFWAVTLYEAVE